MSTDGADKSAGSDRAGETSSSSREVGSVATSDASSALTPGNSLTAGASAGPQPGLIPNGYGDEDPAILYAFRFVESAKPPVSRSGRRLVVCHRDELPVGSRRIVDDGGQGIGVFNINGRFYAIKNVCPHAGAELCRGTVHATHKPSGVGEFEAALHGRVLRCPWHGWEFDIPTGKGLYDRVGRVATYVVEVDSDDNVVVVL